MHQWESEGSAASLWRTFSHSRIELCVCLSFQQSLLQLLCWVVGRADRHLLPQWGTQVLCSLCIYPVRDCTVLPRQPQGMDQTHGVSGATHKIDRQSKCNNKYSAVIVSCDFDFQTTRALLTSAYALYTGYIYIYIYIYKSKYWDRQWLFTSLVWFSAVIRFAPRWDSMHIFQR